MSGLKFKVHIDISAHHRRLEKCAASHVVAINRREGGADEYGESEQMDEPTRKEIEEHEHEKRKLSGTSNMAYGKTAERSHTKGRRPRVKGRTGGYKTDCPPQPTDLHATVKCVAHSCRYDCHRGYKFPDGKRQLIIVCENKKWQVKGSDFEELPSCTPECNPPCQNNGICVSPNMCNCSDMYQGPQCQFKKNPCYNEPRLPNNSNSTCSHRACTVECRQGYQFPDGSSITNLICRDGNWVPTRSSWVTLPDCEAKCDPPCKNGGICLSYNMCQCPKEFRGRQCQYSKTACTAKKLNFNGGYNCSDNGETYTCEIHCHSNARFSQPPASSYICNFSTGEFVPAEVPKCIYESSVEIHSSDNEFFNEKFHFGTGIFSNKSWSMNKIPDDSRMFVDIKPPKPGACYTWGGSHYKTFDGNVISFDNNCSYTLVRNAVDNTFSINIEPQKGYRAINIFAFDKEYTLKRSRTGIPVLVTGSRQHAIPVQLPGVTVEFTAHYVEVALFTAGVTVKWDAENFVSVEVSESLWNKTVGLCGRIDGYPENDQETKDGTISTYLIPFVNTWQVDTLGETCPTTPDESHKCDSPESQLQEYAKEASSFCNKLLNDPRFAKCRTVVDVQPYYEACRWDYCGCKEATQSNCACDSIAVFVRECTRQGVTSVTNWRDKDTCPMKCQGGRVYMSCQPASEETCVSPESTSAREKTCEEGCYCPVGTVLHNQECIERKQCPCQLRGRVFQPGESIPKDCNTCTCVEGKWVCTQVNCGSRCGSVGDPHYITFDGFRYDFMGKCSYYLVKGTNYSIETENVPCLGAISENMFFASSSTSPSCTKAVTVRLGDQVIRLKQNREVLVNGAEVRSLPVVVAGAYIHIASSIFLLVEMPNGLVVWWDGATRVYVDAPAILHGQTQGLCGTFNMNQKDDFLTPEGDVEQSVTAFANKWKTQEKCEDEPEKDPSNPCDVNIHNKAVAQKYCSKLHGPLFESCNWLVDYEPYYQDCMFDLCSCQQKIGQCLCPIMAAYAKECARKGVNIDWRNTVRECGMHCPGGQVYHICGNTCTRSCESISRNPDCRPECVEGCNCPLGQTLNDVGECIPISECTCKYKGLDFPAGHKELRYFGSGPQLCTCTNADWSCEPASKTDVDKYPSTFLKDTCSAAKNEEFTTCEPPEPITCKNMHYPPEVSTAVCQAGCTCKKGFVLEAHTKQCIKPTECPCHHGGRSYAESETIQEECNTCTCRSGRWECTERVCSGVCTAWGDTHFKTFDARIYDFHGSCDYVLSKGASESGSFVITIQNAPCSSLGVSCSKSVTLKVISEGVEQSVTFTRDKTLPLQKNMERIILREAGLFVFAEATDLGVVVQWDRGTRVYVMIDPRWRNKVKGLCGNYNNDMLDDFQTPSGGISEVSAVAFGDSWRLQGYCPESIEITDACAAHPNRKLWAMKKCGVMKSAIFQPCHSEVPLDPYIDRCIFDTCACDMGGDCECLCTAVAAYAQECNLHGVPIKWRSQDLCPIQCDEKCSNYQPCVKTCPVETCDNHLKFKSLTHLCKEETCVEGCEIKPCPPGQVYYNNSATECVPVASCKPLCLQFDNVTYYEGDLVKKDDCHSCYCSHNKVTCIGTPCTTEPPYASTTTPTEEESSTPVEMPSTEVQMEPTMKPCEPGWTPWMNKNPLPDGKTASLQTEPLPIITDMKNHPNASSFCSISHMKKIECRVVGSHESAKDTGFDSECSLERGLICRGSNCPDFEIRVLCDCSNFTSKTSTTTTASPAPGHIPCDVTHPNSPHEVDCHIFYHCKDTPEGPELVEKTCGPFTMYNRDTQVCDHSYNVIAKWPHCASSVSTSSTEPGLIFSEKSTTEACSEGWSEWFNTTVNTIHEGDIELLSSYQEVLPCNLGQVTNIECKFYRDVPSGQELVDYWMSSDPVTCKTKQGLVCNGRRCKDYAIRIFCSCGGTKPSSPITVSTTETVSTSAIYAAGSTPQVCPPGEVWESCSIRCSQICHFYLYYIQRSGQCLDSTECVAGCVTEDLRGGCPPGKFLRDEKSCVQKADCTCHSRLGNVVPPGETYHETSDEVCQCLNGDYFCKNNTITTTEGVLYTVTVEPISSENLVTTETPPAKCDPSRYIPLVQGDSPLQNSAFSSSNPPRLGHEAHNARIYSGKTRVTAGSWIPKRQDKDEFLQIDLGDHVPVYGVVVQGDPEGAGYVTSYRVLHGDGHLFRYVMNAENSPMKFRGPIDGKSPVIQMFHKPVEARYIRFNPQTWEKEIAMRVDVIGCGEGITESTTPTILETETTSPIQVTIAPIPECEDEMGLDSGKMNIDQVSVSSVRNGDKARYGTSQVPLSTVNDEDSGTGGAWIPATNDVGQWLQFDFLEPRNLTGIITKGQNSGNAWTEVFKVQYSHDGEVWNPVLDRDGNVKEFPANFDSETPQKNLFDRVLQTQYLRVLPIKWHNHIALRAEVIGCYLPYPAVSYEPTTTTELPLCNACPGVPLDLVEGTNCNCAEPLLWDGKDCVNSTKCPCYVKHIRYDVGVAFHTENCDRCVCKLNGIPDCNKIDCKPCEKGLRRMFSPSCECTCKPCPEDTVLCPTTNICINESLWCDGVEHCPDDERNCVTTTSIETTVSPAPEKPTPPPCPPIECEPGYVRVAVKPHSLYLKTARKGHTYTKGGRKEFRRPETKKVSNSLPSSECVQYECIPEKYRPGTRPCGKPRCPPKYQLVTLSAKGARCPRYECLPPEATCNVTGRTFNTFDGTEFKYDICNHILAEDNEDRKWDISLVSKCSDEGPCSKHLVVIQDEHLLLLHPDMSSEFDNTKYTPDETKRIGGRNKAFLLSRIGNSLLFKSNRYGFWIIWDSQSNVKIGVPGKLSGKVDGLCGFYNGHSHDDKLMSNGELARTTKEFGDSWSNSETPDCKVYHCPVDLQKKAYEMCSLVRLEPLSKCRAAVNTDQFQSHCIETVCECLAANSSIEDCRCQALLNFVIQCQEADSSIDLTGWRIQHDCPGVCEPPLVHYDCYQHECEPTCDGLRHSEQCQAKTEACFEGCFCSDGLVRKGDKCVKPNECRDCVCDGFGDPQYMTFDRSNYTFNGNCTYVAARDVNPTGNHEYQVLVSNKQCPDEPSSTCTQAVSINYQEHTVSMKRSASQLEVYVDGSPVTDFSSVGPWLRLNKIPGTKVTALIVPLQLEVSYFFYNYQFTVRLSSHSSGGRTEGLCGSCNGNQTDDFLLPNGTLANTVDDFGLSWLVTSNSSDENCQPPTVEEGCLPLPPDEDPCMLLMDAGVFEKCRNILDPSTYVAACQFDLCHSLDRRTAACRDIEAYVRDCERAGICLDWRSEDMCPFTCPEGLEYRACQSGCTKTCENLKEDLSSCDSTTIDGCFCPDGKVFRGNECVNINKCEPCDADNHYDGDTWNEDRCTNCTCIGRNKECQRTDCSAVTTICESGMTAVEITTSEMDCCKKVICVPAVTTPAPGETPPPCPKPKIPECGKDQEQVSITAADGCQTIVCQCLPCNETEEIGTPDLEVDQLPTPEPGLVQILVSGCCSHYEWVCNPKECPEPYECTSPLEPIKSPAAEGKCCPTYSCGLPPDKCVIEMKNISKAITREIGYKWQETPCTECMCIRNAGGTPEIQCNNTVCPSADMGENITIDYVVESVVPPGACCPHIKRNACKIGERVLKPGQSWVSQQLDHCQRYMCLETDEGTVKKDVIERCITSCDLGSKYHPPEPNSRDCCGQCKPVGCVHSGKVYVEGEVMRSEDNCTQYSCLLLNGTFQIDALTTKCPEVPSEILDDYEVILKEVPSECCKKPHYLACKHDGVLYKPGETWESPSDPCKNITCIEGSNGELSKSEVVQTCSEACSMGWQYIPPPPGSPLCCGYCKQVACVHDGQLYDAGSTWKSSDGCTDYTCLNDTSGQFQLTSSAESCPMLDNCKPEDIYQDGCCRKCRMNAGNLLNCQPRPTELHQKMIKRHDLTHGLCENLEPVKNFAVCEGQCLSSTRYNAYTNKHDNECKCCQPTKYTHISVTMTCPDKHVYRTQVPVPTICSCHACGEASRPGMKSISSKSTTS
ncbi:hemocytin [Anabrus simplex]|uniref:hemocytin n=1 Tax=Anabrus simplex TaxID=316456 RepID=UPI0035A310D9